MLFYYIKIDEKQKEEILPADGTDKFGIQKIYQTIEGGREWYVDMENPLDDASFYITSDIPVRQENDGSLYINNSQVRMNVETPDREREWKNVEMTGYVKAVSAIKSNDEDNGNKSSKEGDEEDGDTQIAWRTRGGRHNSDNPCEGTALSNSLEISGKTEWKKEIWHTGGYTDAAGIAKATEGSSILNRWIGFKSIIYNIDNDSAVKMETFIDEHNNNQWKKVSEVIDNGEWYANSEDFYDVDCRRSINHIITNSGPIATFRADDLAFNFKNLSIREIQSPGERLESK